MKSLKDIKSTKDIKVSEKISESIIGQDEALNVIKKASKQRRNVLLIGSPGTGKCVGKDIIIPTDKGDLTAKELYNNLLESNKEIPKPDGYYLKPNKEINAFSINQKGKIIKSKIINAYKSNTKKNCFKITTKLGSEIIVSGEHPILTLNNGNLEFQSASELKIGITIPLIFIEHYPIIYSDSQIQIKKQYKKLVDKIKSIETVQEETYDFEVENTHNFLTGTGIIAHNSLLGQALAELIPKEKVVDIISIHNPTDENRPLIKVVPQGEARKLQLKAKLETSAVFKRQTIIMLLFVILVSLLPYYFWKTGEISDVIYASSMITGMIFIIGFVFFLNISKKLQPKHYVPKILVDNADMDRAPFYDACLLPGQKVLTNPCPIKIEDTKGKLVYNAEGKRQQVTKVERKPWKGLVYHIKPRLLFSFTATPNHPFLVLDRPLTKLFKSREFNRILPHLDNYIKWKKANELKLGDLLIYPEIEHTNTYPKINIKKLPKSLIRFPEQIPLDEELAEIFGWYLAEGYPRIKTGKHYIGLTLGSTEINYVKRLQYLFKKIFNLNSLIDTHNKQELELLIYSKDLAYTFKELFGSGAKNKRIPQIIFESPKSVKFAFLKAYNHGDGWDSDKTVSFATTSNNIAEDIVFLFSSLGLFPSCSFRKMQDSQIKGRKIKGPEIYEFTFNGKQTDKFGKTQGKYQHYFSSGNWHFIPIRKIWTEQYEGDIINMETEDGTYLMPCITHNTGSHAGSLLGDVLHDPLQSIYILESLVRSIQSNGVYGLKQLQKIKLNKLLDPLFRKHESELIKQDKYEAFFTEKDELQVLAENNKQIEESEVLSANRYPFTGNLIKITTETGKTLLVTPEHKVAVKRFGKIIYKAAEKLTRFDKVITLN